MKPFFSILIPVYNVEKYLTECLDSVLAQSFTDYEVIAIDDGSNDKSGLICDEYGRKYSNFTVIHKKNEGLISSRRRAIEKASGEYCVFLDSDDKLAPECLGRLHDTIKEYLPDTVLYTYYSFTNDGKREIKKGVFDSGELFEGERKKELYKLIASGPAISSIWTKATKTDILRADTTDYTEYYGRNMAEDVLQSLPILTLSKKIVYLNEPLYYYRYNPDSVSRSYSPERIEAKNILHVYRAKKKYLKLWGCENKEFILRTEACHFNDVMYTFFKTYECAEKKNDVLRYDWSRLMPDELVYPLSENPYISEKHLKIYNNIKKGKIFILRLEMMGISLYNKYKKAKKRKNAKNK